MLGAVRERGKIKEPQTPSRPITSENQPWFINPLTIRTLSRVKINIEKALPDDMDPKLR